MSQNTSLINAQRGFTLLEIMVVIVILGVLASLVVPSLMGNKDRADRQKAVSDLIALENALDLYRLDNGHYPSAAQGLSALTKKPTIAPLPRRYNSDGYIRRLPSDPWGNDYRFLPPAGGTPLILASSGPDGVADTDDDVFIDDGEK